MEPGFASLFLFLSLSLFLMSHQNMKFVVFKMCIVIQQCGQINLIPMPKSDRDATPNIDFGVFCKETTTYQLPQNADEDDISVNKRDSNVFCKTFIRDLTGNAKGGKLGIYTR